MYAVFLKCSNFRESIERMKNLLRDGIDSVSSEFLEKANRNVERILTAVTDAKNELEEAKRKANITEKYWDKVEAARKFFEVSCTFIRQCTEFV
jgi:hemerythrin-like domain-containing protein